MEANTYIIDRNQIPEYIYFCGGDDEWSIIYLCEFENGLQCILGSGNHQTTKRIIESTKDEMDYVLANTNSPEELQNYYYENFQDFKKYSDCVKIFNYYINNQHLIDEAFYSYFDQNNVNDEEVDNQEELDDEIIVEEGYSSD
jgi:hypothetical protein